MIRKLWTLAAIACLVLGLGLMTSCSKKVVKQEPVSGVPDDNPLMRRTPSYPSSETAETLPPAADYETDTRQSDNISSEKLAERKKFENQDIYFAYDSSGLTMEAQQILQEKAAWMKKNSWASIVIEGHCDERGTTEYNLSLGDRRAEAVKAFLGDLGISAARMTTISFGEEKPLDFRHIEEAMSKNRRAHFIIK